MREILQENQKLKPPKLGDIVEGTVIEKKSSILYLDLGIFGTGIIYGKEFQKAKEELKKVKVGDKILAKIVEIENEDGFVELSISGASKEIALELLERKKEKGEKIKVTILGTNKGGLLTKISGLPAFLPISQLAIEKYPELKDATEKEILNNLKKFVGKEMEVKILGILEDGQIILTEKLVQLEEKEKEAKNYKVGETVEAEVVGIFDYGAILKIGENLEGILPKDEIESGDSLKLGDKIKVKISNISDKKISFSLKL